MSVPDAAAQAIIDRCALAYQSLPAFSGRIRTSSVAQFPDTLSPPAKFIEYAVGSGTDASFQMDGYGGTAVGNQVYLIQENRPDVYAVCDLDHDLPTTMQSVSGAAMFMPPQIAFRGNDDPAAWLSALGLGLMTGLKPVAVSSETDTSGKATDIIEFQGNQGTLKVSFNTATAHVERIDLFIADSAFAYVVEEEIIDTENAVRFDPARRKQVASFSGFVGEPAKVGGAGPDITLPTKDGQSMSISQAKGRWLVLDFWALWCRPCLAAMPHIEELAKRLKKSGAAVEIWTIALIDADNKDDILKQIRDMWTMKGFHLPVLIDQNGLFSQEAYGIRSVPTTVILNPDGMVEAIQPGLSPTSLEALIERFKGTRLD